MAYDEESGDRTSEVVALVTAYLDETMEPEKRQAFDRHLETCERCVGYLDQVRRVIALTGRPPAETLSREFQQHLTDAFNGIDGG